MFVLTFFMLLQLGTVETVQGDVAIIRVDGTEIQASEGVTISAGDIIKTSQNSSLTIKLKDESVLRIDEGAQVRITEDIVAKGSGLETVVNVVEVLIGKIHLFIQKVRKRFNVTSPSVVLGVKGTELSFGVAPDTSSVAEVKRGEVMLYDTEERLVKADERALFDIIEGVRVESLSVPFDFEGWYSERLRRYQERQAEVLRKFDELMRARLKRYEVMLSEAAEVVKVKKAGEVIESLLSADAIRNGLSSGFSFFKREGIERPAFIKDFETINKRWDEIERAVMERFEKKKREVERKFQKKLRKIEEKFKEFERKFK